MFLIKIVVNRIGIDTVFLFQLLVLRGTLGEILNKVGNDIMILIAPRIFVSPVITKVPLHIFHLFHESFLGIFLHFKVQRGINLESCAVKVYSIVLAPLFQIVGNGFAEV